MSPAKRRPATPASKGQKSQARKSQARKSQARKRAATKDSTEEAPTVDADGDHLRERLGMSLRTLIDLRRDAAPPTETGQVDPEDRATTPLPGRSRALHPQRVWPD